LGTPVHFGTGDSAGYVDASAIGSLVVCSNATPNYSVEVRVWPSRWLTYDAAVAGGAAHFGSAPLTISLPVCDPPCLPTELVGLNAEPQELGLSGPTLTPGGDFQLNAALPSGFEVQWSEDLRTWTSLYQVLDDLAQETVVDTNAPVARRFYRAVPVE
jgi:hypothetical protein